MGNFGLLLMLSVLWTFGLSGLAAAHGPTPAAPSAVSAALEEVSDGQTQIGLQLQFQAQPVTAPFTSAWVDVFGPEGQSVTAGAVRLPAAVISGTVYSIVYQVYTTVAGLLGDVVGSTSTAVQSVTNLVYAVYYDVYLQPPRTSQPTFPSFPSPTTVSVTPVTPTPSPLPFSTLTTTVQLFHGTPFTVAAVTLESSLLSQALANLPATASAVRITVPASALAAGGYVSVQLPSAAVGALLTADKSLDIATPEGDVALSPALLTALKGMVPAGERVTLTMHKVSALHLAVIRAETPASERGILVLAGEPLQISLGFASSNDGQLSQTFEPTGGLGAEITLPYGASAVTGLQALKLGVYRWSLKAATWQYVGGVVNLDNGTITVPVDHFSIYGIFADNQTFADIQGFWAQSDIEILVAHHIVQGVSATRFDPNGPVTRAEFAALIVRALHLPQPAVVKAPFRDVAPGAWYAGVVAAAAKAGIIQGYPNDTFAPNLPITREQMAVMIVRAMGAAHQAPSIMPQEVPILLAPYRDQGKVAVWAKTDLAAAIATHIIKGVTAHTLVPAANTTRAQAAVMVKRLLAYLGDL